jgi:hypothetical protein
LQQLGEHTAPGGWRSEWKKALENKHEGQSQPQGIAIQNLLLAAADSRSTAAEDFEKL